MTGQEDPGTVVEPGDGEESPTAAREAELDQLQRQLRERARALPNAVEVGGGFMLLDPDEPLITPYERDVADNAAWERQLLADIATWEGDGGA